MEEMEYVHTQVFGRATEGLRALGGFDFFGQAKVGDDNVALTRTKEAEGHERDLRGGGMV